MTRQDTSTHLILDILMQIIKCFVNITSCFYKYDFVDFILRVFSDRRTLNKNCVS